MNDKQASAEDALLGANLISTLIDKGGISRQQLLIVGLCLIFNMLDGFDITAMAVTVNDMGSDLNLTADKLGLVFSFSLAGMMMGAMFVASLSDVYGRRPVVIASLLVVGSTVILTAYVGELWQLISLRFISGLGAGAMLASQATLASEYSPDRYRALAVAVVTAGYPLGAMFTGLVAGYIVPDYGWRGMFIAGGVVTLGMTVLAYVLLAESLQFLCEKQPPRALQRVNEILARFSVAPIDELPVISSQTIRTAEDNTETVFGKMLKLLTKEHKRATLILWSAFFMCFCTLYFLMSWTPKLMVMAGFSAQTGNYAFSLLNFGGVTGILLLGTLATRWKLSNVISSFLILSAIAMMLFALAPRTESVLLPIIFLVGLLLQGGFTGLYAAAAKIYPTEIRSTGVGWGIGLGRFGAVVGPAVAGFMIAAGVSMGISFMVFAVPMLIGGIFAYWLHIR